MVMQKTHPSFSDAIISLQTSFMKERKWEHVLGIGQVYRSQVAPLAQSFRVEPFLMEAYGLIQYCRYADAKAVLNQAKYFAEKYQRSNDLLKIQKAMELEELGRLYRNMTLVTSVENDFAKNQIEWRMDSGNESLLQALNKVIVKTETQCR